MACMRHADTHTHTHAVALPKVQARIADFQGPGGIIDLVYSVVFTRGQLIASHHYIQSSLLGVGSQGVERVNQEALSEGGELPLIPKCLGHTLACRHTPPAWWCLSLSAVCNI